MTLHQRHVDWLTARALDPTLAEQFGLETVSDNGANWLVVPYREGEETINRKWRLTSEKRHKMDPGAPLALWNADCLKDPRLTGGQAPLVITEGEWDALAAIQSGIPFAVSVPNGAPGTPTQDVETAKRYEWVDRHAQALAGVKEFVIATDADTAGHNLAADLVALLGVDRCRFIEYPFPCKDLNEVLVEYGQERVVEIITTSKPYPVKGLYTLDDFPERGEVRSFTVGVAPIAELIRIVPGTLTVVTGYANMGKSSLLNNVIAHALSEHFPVCVASFETDVKPILRDGLRQALMRCGKHEISSRDTSAADALLRDRLTVISQTVDEDMEMDLDEFLRLASIAVRRHGAKMVVLDPWNELEHKKRHHESETEYIGRAIRSIKHFIRTHDVAFWIVAHPAKPMPGVKSIPGLYEISGSAHWANKADYGVTYHRKSFDQNEAEIVVTKVRMGLPGRRGSAKVTYDFRTSEFVEIVA
ncbi:AAA family ATPase [Sphingopyxis sp. 550A]